jgi:hypothetical protein
LRMLEGASQILNRDPKPVWMIEIGSGDCHPDGKNPDMRRTFELMWENGYKAYTADSNLQLITEKDVGSTLKGGNFLFK